MIIPVAITTEPSTEPVTLDEIKTHLRGIDHSDHDDLLNGLIQGARQRIEIILGRALPQQTRVAYYENWPAGDVFDLPNPIQSIVDISYTDVDDTEYTFDNYTVDAVSEPGRVVLDYENLWPTAILHYAEYPIQIQYTCGYDTVPEPIRTAIKLDVELKYNMPPEGWARYTEDAIESLLAPYKLWRF